MFTILALIPARGGSKSLKNKNLQKVNGIPLVTRAIKQAQKSIYVTDIVVSTDSNIIFDTIKKENITILGRPNKFAHDTTVQEVDSLLCWMILEWEKLNNKQIDIAVLLYPTSPLRRFSTIDATISKVANQKFDSALSLTEDTSYLWTRNNISKTVTPTNYDPMKRAPRQLENWNQWIENKAVYAMTRDLILTTKCRLGGKISHVAMNKLESIDIDNLDDLKLCDAIISNVLKDELK